MRSPVAAKSAVDIVGGLEHAGGGQAMERNELPHSMLCCAIDDERLEAGTTSHAPVSWKP